MTNSLFFAISSMRGSSRNYSDRLLLCSFGFELLEISYYVMNSLESNYSEEESANIYLDQSTKIHVKL